jgi:N utilization substance protein B
LQVLYQVDIAKLPVAEAILAYYSTLYSEESPEQPDPDEFMEQLARGAMECREEIDNLISRHSSNWRIDRMPVVDRNILRLAVYEMLHYGTPPAVAIDEALELARRFSGDEAVSFVNGVLDALRRARASAAPPTPPVSP